MAEADVPRRVILTVAAASVGSWWGARGGWAMGAAHPADGLGAYAPAMGLAVTGVLVLAPLCAYVALRAVGDPLAGATAGRLPLLLIFPGTLLAAVIAELAAPGVLAVVPALAAASRALALTERSRPEAGGAPDVAPR
jgi:hypothetical protein